MLIGILGQSGSGKDTIGRFIRSEADADTIALADPMKELVKQVFGFTHNQLWGPSERRNEPDRRFGRKWWQPWKARSVYINHELARMRLASMWTFRWLRRLMPDATPAQLDAAWGQLGAWARRLLEDAREDGYLTPRKVLQTLGTEWGREINEDLWIDYGIRRAKQLIEDDGYEVVVFTDCRFVNEAKKISEVGEVWRVTRPGYDGSIAAGVTNHRSERDQGSDEIKQYVSLEISNDGSLDDLEARVVAELQKRLTDANGEVQRCG